MTNAEIELEPVSEGNIDMYLALEKRAESRTYTAAQNHEEANEELARGPIYFIKQLGRVCGTVSYSIQDDGSAYINGLAIDPDFQGQGLGKAVLTLILEKLKNISRVWLVVHPENDRAIALYESFGFTVTDRIENFHGDGEPRIILTRNQ